jgi:outer membrane lipoprotein-sorting protein
MLKLSLALVMLFVLSGISGFGQQLRTAKTQIKAGYTGVTSLTLSLTNTIVYQSPNGNNTYFFTQQ